MYSYDGILAAINKVFLVAWKNYILLDNWLQKKNMHSIPLLLKRNTDIDILKLLGKKLEENILK